MLPVPAKACQPYLLKRIQAESFLSGATSGSLFQYCQIAMVNVQVYQFGRTEKSSKIRCEKKVKITVSDDSSQSQ